MPKFSYDTILSSVEDSCALTQPLVSPVPEVTPQPRPVRTSTQQTVEAPPSASGSGSAIQVENIQVVDGQI